VGRGLGSLDGRQRKILWHTQPHTSGCLLFIEKDTELEVGSLRPSAWLDTNCRSLLASVFSSGNGDDNNSDLEVMGEDLIKEYMCKCHVNCRG
jgi:hypothetical protein